MYHKKKLKWQETHVLFNKFYILMLFTCCLLVITTVFKIITEYTVGWIHEYSCVHMHTCIRVCMSVRLSMYVYIRCMHRCIRMYRCISIVFTHVDKCGCTQNFSCNLLIFYGNTYFSMHAWHLHETLHFHETSHSLKQSVPIISHVNASSGSVRSLHT